MTILYSCVARGTTILCSQANAGGSFENEVTSMLPNIPTRNDGKTTYKSSSYLYHCVVDNGIIYLCAAKPEFGKQQSYNFLAEIKRKFQGGTIAMRAVSAESHELDSEFSMELAQEMERYSKSDNVAKLRSQVDEVKDVMTQNIERVLDRGEKLDDLVDKTEDLEASAATFQKTARRIKRKYWWKNTKMMLILVLVGITVVIIIAVLIAYGAGAFSNDDTPPKNNAVTSTTQSSG
ncbi:vesicle-associated membrane protein 7-like [Mytilus edulis]